MFFYKDNVRGSQEGIDCEKRRKLWKQRRSLNEAKQLLYRGTYSAGESFVYAKDLVSLLRKLSMGGIPIVRHANNTVTATPNAYVAISRRGVHAILATQLHVPSSRSR